MSVASKPKKNARYESKDFGDAVDTKAEESDDKAIEAGKDK